jgi:hypothetical protein
MTIIGCEKLMAHQEQDKIGFNKEDVPVVVEN